MSSRRMAGVTLVELVIAIVIIGTALAGLAATFARASQASADPMVRQQMLAIGEGMMEEVLLKPFKLAADEVAAPARAQFNDVRDYDQVDDANPGYSSTGIRDIDGDPIPGLEAYGVSVRVNSTALNGVPAGETLRVTVTVRHGAEQLSLTGWRTSPWRTP